MGDPDDSQLLVAWRDGDAAAGERLVARHVAGVFRFFRSRLDDGAEDLAQATFVACQEGVHRLRDSVSFRAFLFAIARNLLLQHLRRKGREAPHGSAGRPPQSVTSIPSRIDDRAEQRYLRRALQSLELADQIIISLHYWEALTTAEIAEVLGRPSGTIKWRLAEARSALRAEIERIGGATPGLVHSTLDGLDRWAASLAIQEDPVRNEA